MKNPKPMVAGALVAGGLLFTTAAAAITLPEQASTTAKEQVETFLGTLPDDAAEAGDTRRAERSEDSDAGVTDEAETADTEDTDGIDGEEPGPRPDTHGSTVSDFATGDAKELEGRARGEAISKLARGDEGDDTPEQPKVEDDTEDEETKDNEDAPSAKGAARAAEARSGR
jgi:hypothetical protein